MSFIFQTSVHIRKQYSIYSKDKWMYTQVNIQDKAYYQWSGLGPFGPSRWKSWRENHIGSLSVVGVSRPLGSKSMHCLDKNLRCLWLCVLTGDLRLQALGFREPNSSMCLGQRLTTLGPDYQWLFIQAPAWQSSQEQLALTATDGQYYRSPAWDAGP